MSGPRAYSHGSRALVHVHRKVACDLCGTEVSACGLPRHRNSGRCREASRGKL